MSRSRSRRDNRTPTVTQRAVQVTRRRGLPAGASRPTPLTSGAASRPATSAAALANATSNSMGDNSRPISAYDTVAPQYGRPGGVNGAGANGTANGVAGVSGVFPPGDPMLPVAGLGARQWMYPVGGNIATQPRSTESTSFATLRNLASAYSAIGLCENAHFRIVERLQLIVKPRPDLLEVGEDLTADKWTKPARQMEEWFQEGPSKRGNEDLTAWMIAAMKDLLEIDAVGVFNKPTRNGRLYALELIAGDTLKCLWDEAGRTPNAPVPAYQQIAYGMPSRLFTVATGICDDTELDYLKIVNRTNSPYGESPIERILLLVNTALRKQHYDLMRFTDGATPEGVIETSQPELFKMTVDQVLEWERMWNDALAGNDQLRVRTKFVPPGFHFTSTEMQQIATELDEYLLNVTISAFGLTKDELGFTDTSNRSTGQSQEAVTYRQAVMPRSNYFAKYFTRLIRRYDGQPLSVVARTRSRPGAPTASTGAWDARFLAGWSGIEEPEDFTAKVQAHNVLVNNGTLGRTQSKRLLGLPVAKGEVEVPPLIMAPAGPDSIVILEDLVAQREQINSAHEAQLDTKIAGAKAAQKQFEAGGNPVMAAGMAAGNVQAGAKQQQAQQAQAAPGGPQGSAPQGGGPQGAPTRRQERGLADDAIGIDDFARWGASADGGAAGAGWSDVEQRDGDAVGDANGDSGAPATRHASGGVSSDGDGGHRGDADTINAGGRGGGAGASGVPSADERTVATSSATSSAQTRRAEGGAEGRAEGGAEASDDEIRAEWARYRERALKDARNGKAPRPFISAILPIAEHAWVAEALAHVATKDEVRAVFTEAQTLTRPGASTALVGEAHAGAHAAAVAPDGAMLAFFLPAEVAQRLATPGGEDPRDLHITLAYLGKAADWTSAQVARLRRVLSQWTADQSALDGTVGASVGAFPLNADGAYPIYARVTVPDLAAWRASLVALLTEHGFFVDQTYRDYVPHVTLAYAAEEPLAPLPLLPSVPVRLDDLTLAMGGVRYAFLLHGKEHEQPLAARVATTPTANPIAELAAAMLASLQASAAVQTQAGLAEMRSRVLEQLGSS